MNVFGIFDCLRKGSALANPALWKLTGAAATGGIGSAAMLTDSIKDFVISAAAAAKGFGYDVHMDDTTARAVGVFVAWLVGLFFTVATTDKLGLLPAKPVASGVAGSAGDAAAIGDAHADAAVGSQPADARAADPVRPVGDGSQDNGGYLRG